MLWWLAQKCCAVADQRPDDVDLQVLATCTWGLQRFTEIQSNAGIILTEAEANEVSSCLFTYNKCFAWLALRFRGDGYLFKVRPKGHYLEHMAFALKELRLNQVKLFAMHSEESFLGKVKSIACRVHGKTLSKRVFERYILCLAVSMHRLKNRYAKNWTTKKRREKTGLHWHLAMLQAIARQSVWVSGETSFVFKTNVQHSSFDSLLYTIDFSRRDEITGVWWIYFGKMK